LAGVSPGLADAIKARGCTPPVVQSVWLSDGAVDEQSDRDNQLGLVMVPWKDFQDVLATSIPPHQIHCRHRLQSFEAVEVRAPPFFMFLLDLLSWAQASGLAFRIPKKGYWRCDVARPGFWAI
jgi:hypothetical protein